MNPLLSPHETAARLPYDALVPQLRELLADASVQVPERLVQALPGGGSLFVMPALDSRIAITKLITFTPGNAGTDRAAIQGDVVVFDVATGERKLILDGPTVTARRTAAVSLLAAQTLAPNKDGPLLILGAGAQGRAHLEAFAQGLPLSQVFIASRGAASANALADYARTLGLQGERCLGSGCGGRRLPAGGDLHPGECGGAAARFHGTMRSSPRLERSPRAWWNWAPIYAGTSRPREG